MQIQNLILEITRKCNFTCAHCLRGDAQNKDIDLKVIDSLLENNNIDYISSIAFTGGEPSLNTKAINYFIDKCNELNIEIGNFYIATNGGKTSGNEEFLHTLIKLYCFCSDNEISQVQISNSDYHFNSQDEESINKLKCLSFVDERTHLNYKYLIHEGKAKRLNELNGTMDSARRIKPEKVLKLDGDYIETEELYINCKGDIVLSCDLSYNRQDKNKIGNILIDKLEDLVVKAEEV